MLPGGPSPKLRVCVSPSEPRPISVDKKWATALLVVPQQITNGEGKAAWHQATKGMHPAHYRASKLSQRELVITTEVFSN